MNQPSFFDMVREFHEGASLPIRPVPGVPPPDRKALRYELIREEAFELSKAIARNDLVEIADGAADLIYVLCGLCLEYGIPLNQIFAEVHRSNMTKVEDAVFREDGKLLKGPNFEPPEIEKILAR